MWTSISALLLLSFYNILTEIQGNTILPSINFQDPNVRYKSVRNVANKIGAFEVKNLGKLYHESKLGKGQGHEDGHIRVLRVLSQITPTWH